ncbi:MAG: heme-binding protein [Gammaproteobacteria bacterium]|nr:heme-binding protein [Gammaproteobacteria bacterium]MDH3858672.1 heme-binding protein [Gammaproteobacteria bacterium]
MNPVTESSTRNTLVRPLIAALVTLALGGCSLLGIRTAEEAAYVVVSNQDDIELREYAAYITVETTVNAEFKDAGNRAFRKLFDYISSENRTRQSIEMTAPVIASETGTADGESIEMTAPVVTTKQQNGWRYAFVLPARYTIDNAPLPVSEDLSLVENKPKRVAVLTFTGSWRESGFRQQLDRLQGWIESNQLESASEPRFAGYDPPWAIPFLRRNEIMIDIKS